MGSLSIWHWLIVLAIVLVVFGTRKLRNVGSDLGGAVKGFKEAMREEQATPKVADKIRTIENEVTTKPAARKPVARKPAAKKPIAKKPAAKSPVASKPAARKKPVPKG
jgi:sec-independent protein translocase protein TatA